uniref:Uncharacterized protein n=1 Tax=Nannospalax galili TaxID=1026970 RepID=A0A8C6RFP7_NANGA
MGKVSPGRLGPGEGPDPGYHLLRGPGASRAATMSAAVTTPTCSPTSAAATWCEWTAAAGCSMSSPTMRAARTSCGTSTTLTRMSQSSSGWFSDVPLSAASWTHSPAPIGSGSMSKRTTEDRW